MGKGNDGLSKEVQQTNTEVRTKRVKFLLTSDTHYGYSPKTHRFHEKFLSELRDVIEEQEIACVIHAGDWSVNKQDQFYRTMKMFRQYIDPRIDLVAVRGNHDFWDSTDGYKVKSKRQWGQLSRLHKEWFKELNIHHLEEGNVVIDDVIVCGYDGWYGQATPPTNDKKMIVNNIEGCPAMVYHSSRAFKELTRVLNTDTSQYAKAICVSHFPTFGGDWKSKNNPNDMMFCANPKYMEPITDKFDVFCVGHSHLHVDRIENNCRLLNAGSDYNQPKFLVFEV